MIKINNKRLLAILGSPHTDGTTATMLDYAITVAEKYDYEVTKINLYDVQINYCKGCRLCLHNNGCVQYQDDMMQISFLLQECDVVILASPTYWSNVPAPVKNLFDRSLGIALNKTKRFLKPQLKRKKYMLLTSCNIPYPISYFLRQSNNALNNMEVFFKNSGMRCIGKFTCTNAEKQKVLPKHILKKIERCFK